MKCLSQNRRFKKLLVRIMKKYISRIVLLFVFIALCFSISGCGNRNNSNSDNTSENSTLSAIEKHTVSITMDNYKRFIEVSSSISHGQTSYTFKGCLSYALYDVVFTLSYSTSSIATDLSTEIFSCNAAGNGFFAGGGKYGAKIEAVSGTVIYWI